MTYPILAIQTTNKVMSDDNMSKPLTYDKSLKVICKPTKSKDIFK